MINKNEIDKIGELLIRINYDICGLTLDEVELLFKYYDIDVDKETFRYMYISPLDYNTSMS